MALTNFNQSVSCDAQSRIGNTTVMYMNASIPQSGSIAVNKSIQDREAYFANQKECDADYAAFNEKIEEIAKQISE